MVATSQARRSLGVVASKFGPAGARLTLVVALLWGALKLNDKATELERREAALQQRVEQVSRREALNQVRGRELQEAMANLEHVDPMLRKASLEEPRPLVDAVVTQARNQPVVLPISGH